MNNTKFDSTRLNRFRGRLPATARPFIVPLARTLIRSGDDAPKGFALTPMMAHPTLYSTSTSHTRPLNTVSHIPHHRALYDLWQSIKISHPPSPLSHKSLARSSASDPCPAVPFPFPPFLPCPSVKRRSRERETSGNCGLLHDTWAKPGREPSVRRLCWLLACCFLSLFLFFSHGSPMLTPKMGCFPHATHAQHHTPHTTAPQGIATTPSQPIASPAAPSYSLPTDKDIFLYKVVSRAAKILPIQSSLFVWSPAQSHRPLSRAVLSVTRNANRTHNPSALSDARLGTTLPVPPPQAPYSIIPTSLPLPRIVIHRGLIGRSIYAK